MKHLFLFLYFFMLAGILNAQVFNIEWQNCFGSSGEDLVQNILAIEDGYFVIGSVGSDDGDVGYYHGGSKDVWLVKTDPEGNLMWEKTYGGTSGDEAFIICKEQFDNFYYILAGTNSSDGDVVIDPYPGSTDYWILKIDMDGNIIWQKIVGGTGGDFLTTGVSTADGGILAVGYTGSTDGDVSINYGVYDWWLIKLSSSGDILWDLSIGSSWFDYVDAVIETSDGGFLVGGGNIVRNDGNQDCEVMPDTPDAVLFKLNSEGEIEWHQCYGGSGNDGIIGLLETTNGYLLSAFSESNDGDMEDSGYHGGHDIWLAEVDFDGNIIWQKSYGGSDSEFAENLFHSGDGGYTVFGITYSNDGDVSGNNSTANHTSIWSFKINAEGEMQSQQCIGGTGEENIRKGVTQISPNRYVIGAQAFYGPSYDLECILPQYLYGDFWVLEVYDTTVGTQDQMPTMQLSVFPNPFIKTSQTNITFELPIISKESILQIRDIFGKTIEELAIAKGQSQLIWDCSTVSSGVYFYHCEIEERIYRGKLVVN
jgi:hypothetical protein